MNPRDLIPTADQIKAVQGIEADLIQRRRKGMAGFALGIGGALFQVLMVFWQQKNLITSIGTFLRALRHPSWSQLTQPQSIGFFAIIVGFGAYFIYRRTSFLAKESKAPFQYTFWVEKFEEVGAKETGGSTDPKSVNADRELVQPAPAP